MQLNCADEWSPLKEVILGSGVNFTSHVRDLSFDIFYQDNLNPTYSYYPRIIVNPAGAEDQSPLVRKSVKQRYIHELNEDLEQMAEVFESLSIKVHRPMTLAPETVRVETPAWSATVLPALNVRDNTLILGDEIIETPPMLRARYFETQLLKPIFMNYFDSGARWTVMPRPLMTDTSFDQSYTDRSVGNTEHITEVLPSPYDVGTEMMFDAAQCIRFGRDLVANIANRNHALGVDWLERHLAGRFRVHRIYGLTANHIDSMVMPLRPGTLLVRDEAVRDSLPEWLAGWEQVVAPPPDLENFPTYQDDDLILTTPFIDLNVLPITPDTVMVNDSCPQLMRTLEKHGFTVVPVRHRHRRIFGGGLHCFTLDTVRLGQIEDYR